MKIYRNKKQIERLYKLSMTGTILGIIITLVLAFLLKDLIPKKYTYIFLLMSFLNYLYRIIIMFRYKYIKKEKWLILHTIGLTLSAAIWGGFISISLTYGIPLEYEFILYTIAIGISGSAVSNIGIIFIVYLLNITFLLSPILIYSFLFLNRETSNIITFLLIMSLLYFLKGAHNYSKSFLEMLKQEEENLKQRDFIQHQSKLAAMGEMLGAIAHQWRQPLNELFINIQNLKYEYEDQNINKRFVNNFIKDNKKTVMFMSNTIDDFRNFFRTDKEKKDFNIKETIFSTISLLKAQLENNNIKINVSGDNFVSNGFIGEFKQVILNLINNSKDAFIEKNIKDAKIEIILKDSKFVIIRDNAGGIPKDIIDRIFEPYFTTKEQGKGTGMGLYMSKMIIENMDGSITVNNIENGTEFTITI